MNVYQMIAVRQSVRKFQKKAFSEELIQMIHNYKGYIFPLYQDESYSIRLVSIWDKNRVKLNGLHLKAPYYILFFGADTPDGRRNAGFLMEKIALYLTEKGIGSCYQGMAHIDRGEDIVPQGQSLLITLACGFPQQELERTQDKAKRLPLERLVSSKEEYGQQMRTVLEAGRLAPSALNRQPWRLFVQKNRIHVFMKKANPHFSLMEKMQDIDIGILLSHLKLAADELWLQMDFRVVDSISERQFKNTAYVLTAMIERLDG